MKHSVSITIPINKNRKGDKGDKGDPGTNGKSAFVLTLDPPVKTFQADKDGNIDYTDNAVTLTATYGGARALITGVDVPAKGEATNCELGKTIAANQIFAIVKITNIAGQPLENMPNKGPKNLPALSGGGTVKVSLKAADGTTGELYAEIRFSVSISGIISQAFDAQNGEFKSKIETFSTENDNLKKQYSEINQKVNSISLKVGQQIGLNILDGGLCRRVITGMYIFTMGEKLLKGAQYTLSMRACVNQELLNEGKKLTIGIYGGSLLEFDSTTMTTKSVTFPVSSNDVKLPLFFDIVKDKSSSSATGDSRAFIEGVQIETGTVSNYIAPKASDYNAKPNLAKNWYAPVFGKKSDGAYCTYEDVLDAEGVPRRVACGKTGIGTDTEILTERTVTVKPNKTYTLSFWAKGTGVFKAACNHCLGSISGDGGVSNASNGVQEIALTTSWKKYSLTFTTDNTFKTPQQAYLTIRAKGYQPSIGTLQTSEMWAYDPKFEEGSMATSQSVEERLLATGIDIYNGQIVMTADDVFVRNNNGEVTAAFDKNGNLKVSSLFASDASGACIQLAITGKGVPQLIAKNSAGEIVWMFDGSAVTNGGTTWQITGITGSWKYYINSEGTHARYVFSVQVTVKNTGSNPSYYTGQVASVKVSNYNIGLTANGQSALVPVGQTGTVSYDTTYDVYANDGTVLPTWSVGSEATVSMNGQSDVKIKCTASYTNYKFTSTGGSGPVTGGGGTITVK